MKNRTKFYLWSLGVLFIQLLGCQDIELPVLQTYEVKNITATTATSGGFIEYSGNEDVIERGVCWSTNPNPKISDNKTVDAAGTGEFISSIVGLSANTTYYIRAYAKTKKNTTYGIQLSFTTLNGLIGISTLPASNVSATSAIIGVVVNIDGGAEITERGICWGKDPNPTVILSNKTLNGIGLGSFEVALTELEPATVYFARSYAKNSVNTIYGNEVIFTTKNGIIKIRTLPVQTFTSETATCGGIIDDDGGADVTARGVCWSVNTSPTINNDKTFNGIGKGSFSSKISSLSEGNLYYYRAYATNSVGTVYGEEYSFLFKPENSAGTETDPYNVAEALVYQNSEVKWLKGYIVGSVKADETISAIDAADDVLFSATGVRNTMVLLADSKTETDYTKCVAVNLPTGEIRTAVNLVDNPSNLGKLLKVNGTLRAYFGIPGVRDLLGFNLEGYVAPTVDFNVPEMSIADVRAQWTGEKKTITDKKKIVGIVVTDLAGGNSGSLKNLTIVSTDNSAGIMVRLTENNTYNMGDKIEIALEGLELNHYGLAILLNNVPTIKTQRIATNQTVTPVATTIANVRANYASYESRLVTVNGTITSGGGGKWYSGTAAGQNNKLTSGADELIMYVTKYATFKDSAVPTGEKTVTGIVGQYSTATATSYQLIIRNLDDVK